jgi:cytochrome c-type biogenesis protein CcmH/NrfF
MMHINRFSHRFFDMQCLEERLWMRIFRHLRVVFCAFVLCVSFVFSSPAHAQIQQPEMPLPSPELAARLKKLESELRCLVCQNQTLAESPAGLAGDLRREVRLLIDQGKSDDEIKTFLQARYGDFVLYKPPVKSTTMVLWYGPFALLLIGVVVFVLVARRRRARARVATSAAVIALPSGDAAMLALLNSDAEEERQNPAPQVAPSKNASQSQASKHHKGKHKK